MEITSLYQVQRTRCISTALVLCPLLKAQLSRNISAEKSHQQTQTHGLLGSLQAVGSTLSLSKIKLSSIGALQLDKPV